ncbi:MAG: 5'-nucleotidase, lipoprotein e(P4) family [Ginsengibacter sp.]
MKKLALIFIVFAASCTTATRISDRAVSSSNTIHVNGKLFTTVFQQRASEYRALCYQAYNIARLRVDQLPQPAEKPFAIMTDIDETVLSNAAYQAHQTLQGKDYDAATWYDWTGRADADTVPGALSFLNYASSKGIKIFYVTNRDEIERKGTLSNLQKFNFPDAVNEHLFLKGEISSKEPRKQHILKDYQIVLLIGDNLNDLSQAFEKKSPDDRMKVTDSLSLQFGKSLIVLPNAVYGDWENALYQYNYKLTPAQRDSILRASLHSY